MNLKATSLMAAFFNAAKPGMPPIFKMVSLVCESMNQVSCFNQKVHILFTYPLD